MILGRNTALWGHSEPGVSDAETLAAIIARAKAFIGIDSGPSKVAATTGIPCLVIWTGHHPVQHFDPMPNVTHLVPKNHRRLLPAQGGREAAEWFERNYHLARYDGREDVPERVAKWLKLVFILGDCLAARTS